jgi:hypothetical protein
MTNLCRNISLASILAIFASPLAHAQKDAASITGQVTDSSGAVVAGARIEAVNLETNYAYHATSSATGEWTITPVRIGTYRITVIASGFNESKMGPLTLDVQQRQRVDVALHPGAVTQTVEVKDTTPRSDTSERSQLVDRYDDACPQRPEPCPAAQLTAGVTE